MSKVVKELAIKAAVTAWVAAIVGAFTWSIAATLWMVL